MCPVKPSTKPQNKTSITTKLTLVVVYFILFAFLQVWLSQECFSNDSSPWKAFLSNDYLECECNLLSWSQTVSYQFDILCHLFCVF